MRTIPLLAGILLALSPLPAPGQQDSGMNALSAAQARFAFDIYRTAGGASSDNAFISPYSISTALAMTMGGARGETEAEMAKALRIDGLGPSVHPAAYELAAELAKRADLPPARQRGGTAFTLKIANGLWGQEGYPLSDGFLALAGERYGAETRLLDFIRNSEQARKTINAAIAGQTEQRITDLLQPGDVPPDTRLILTNAIYFKATWADAFEGRWTKDAPFTRLDGSTVTASMMHRVASFRYFGDESVQAIEVPYLGGDIVFLAILPAEGQFKTFEKEMSGDSIAAMIERMSVESVQFKMPRFEMRSRFALKPALEALGMKRAFRFGQADFSGMNGNRDFFIGGVIHEAFVKVDEDGTEAAAATAVTMRTGSARPREPVSMTLDRPFLFLIRDRKTGAILFAGRVMDPAVRS